MQQQAAMARACSAPQLLPDAVAARPCMLTSLPPFCNAPRAGPEPLPRGPSVCALPKLFAILEATGVCTMAKVSTPPTRVLSLPLCVRCAACMRVWVRLGAWVCPQSCRHTGAAQLNKGVLCTTLHRAPAAPLARCTPCTPRVHTLPPCAAAAAAAGPRFPNALLFLDLLQSEQFRQAVALQKVAVSLGAGPGGGHQGAVAV